MLGTQAQLAQTIGATRSRRASVARRRAAAALANSLRPPDYSIRVGGWNFQARAPLKLSMVTASIGPETNRGLTLCCNRGSTWMPTGE
jgi:hypothetical protein